MLHVCADPHISDYGSKPLKTKWVVFCYGRTPLEKWEEGEKWESRPPRAMLSPAATVS
jgi:hypothetical protein